MAARDRKRSVRSYIPRHDCEMGGRPRLCRPLFIPRGDWIELAGLEQIVEWDKSVRGVRSITADIPNRKLSAATCIASA